MNRSVYVINNFPTYVPLITAEVMADYENTSFEWALDQEDTLILFHTNLYIESYLTKTGGNANEESKGRSEKIQKFKKLKENIGKDYFGTFPDRFLEQ